MAVERKGWRDAMAMTAVMTASVVISGPSHPAAASAASIQNSEPPSATAMEERRPADTVRLTDDVMRRFLAAVKGLRAEGQHFQKGGGGVAAAMALNAKMQDTLKAHGFTPQAWYVTLGVVTSAMAGIQVKDMTSDSNLAAQFAAERKSIEQAKDFPPAIKQRMLRQLVQQKNTMMAVRHHDDPNEAVVRPYLQQLQTVFGK